MLNLHALFFIRKITESVIFGKVRGSTISSLSTEILSSIVFRTMPPAA